MKKNRTMRVAGLMLALTLITSSFVGNTFAKYTSSAHDESYARVAKWDVKINNETIKGDDTSFTFDLFTTVLDTVDGNQETDAKTSEEWDNFGTTENRAIIAPGTQGQFTFAVRNESEVNAIYNIGIDVAHTGDSNYNTMPLEFKVGEGDWMTPDVMIYPAIDATLDMGTEQSVTVYWRWAFEREAPTSTEDYLTADEEDTALGLDGNAKVMVTATVTATQKD